MSSADVDVAIVGAGIIGLATAHALRQAQPDLEITNLDKEDRLLAHQTGRNSGVIHSGIYYTPGSLKASTCRAGRAALLDFCAEHAIDHEVCGKVIVATSDAEQAKLAALADRANANGVAVTAVDATRVRELEPHCAGQAGLHVHDAGIVDFAAVADALATSTDVRLGQTVQRVDETTDRVMISTGSGTLRARWLVNCAGLQSDRVAANAGVDSSIRIMPFRGEFHELVPERRNLVNNLIYPVPDPQFPFLGVHLTRSIDGGVHVGPNAVFALSREGYRWRDVSVRDSVEIARSKGTWSLARKYWRTGLGEVYRSISTRAMVRALNRLVPAIRVADLEPAPSGVRAQAIDDANGALLDDFAIHETARAVHVVNAPSPAATASLEIGRLIAERVMAKL